MTFPRSPVSLLQELIRIPSVNPDSASGQGATGEGECARRVSELLQDCGARVEFEEVLPGRPNVIGRFPGGEGKPGILFAPHLDTVSVEGMTVDPFGAAISEGRIHGRGASDTKGTMAAMLWALHQRRDRIARLPVSVAFVGLMGEEAGQPGSKHFAERHGDEFSFAIVGEPTSLEVVHAHKGCIWHRLSTTGRSCHASTPELGENAIRKLLPALEALLSHLESALPAFADSVLGLPTVSLGMIRGGSSPNIVPATCEAFLDVRETPALHAAGGSAALVRSFLERSEWAGRIALETLGDSKPLLTDPATDGVRRLLSIGSSLAVAPWYCDAGRLAEGGIPAVACGPGNIAQAHTKNEYLAIADLEAGCEFYGRFLDTYEG
ncbi:MAG: M20 family metallopeptidase [Verrucomicrobia bacterium]|nr:M20 family metallopeptidase [Verrucomicrobiota bacterium]